MMISGLFLQTHDIHSLAHTHTHTHTLLPIFSPSLDLQPWFFFCFFSPVHDLHLGFFLGGFFLAVRQPHSLSVIKHNLGLEAEQDLRSALVKRLARGCIYSGSGNIFALDDKPAGASVALGTSPSTVSLAGPPPAAGAAGGPATLCYYCLLREHGEDVESSVDDAPLSSSEFLVCCARVHSHACLLSFLYISSPL